MRGLTGTLCLTLDKTGETRLKWQLACGKEPSLLCRTGIKPLNGTAVDKTGLNFGSKSVNSSADQMAITQAGHGVIISDVNDDVGTTSAM